MAFRAQIWESDTHFAKFEYELDDGDPAHLVVLGGSINQATLPPQAQAALLAALLRARDDNREVGGNPRLHGPGNGGGGANPRV